MNKRLIIGIAIVLFLVVTVIVLFKLARAYEVSDSSKTAWLTDKFIAHKGIHNNDAGVAENSISSFSAAIEQNYPIEMDVSLTKDKKVVVFHDKKLKRMLGIDKYLSDTSFDEISGLKLLNSNDTIPLFSDVLNLIGGKVPLLIEIKNEGTVGELESLVYNELKNYKGKFAIQSFNPYSVKWFKVNAPDVLRGQLSGSFDVSDYEHENAGTSRLPWYKKFLLKNLLLTFESKPNFVAYEVKCLPNNMIRNFRKKGIPILGWTIDNKEMYDKIKIECDNFIVNNVNINK